jgi:tRNA(fMet)-specific endonuclease VapC
VLLSALSLAELQRGLYKGGEHTALRAQRLAILLAQIPVLPFDVASAEAHGRIIAQCGWVRGRDFDRMIMIAAHALSTGSILVTANEADFRDIPGLAMVNWVSVV